MKENIFNNFGMGLIFFGISKTNLDFTNIGDLEDYNQEIIRKVFFCELRKFGQTTSLDVKNKLRQLKYFAEQKQVSHDLKIINEEVDSIESFSNGKFITYYIDENQMQNPGIIDIQVTDTPKDDQLDETKDVLVDEIQFKYTRRNGDVMVATKLGHSGEWECKYNGFTKSCETLYFNEKWTRDQVRAAYASLNLVKSSEVRASRVK